MVGIAYLKFKRLKYNRAQQDNDKTNVEPVHSYYAFHTRSDMSGVKGIIFSRNGACIYLLLYNIITRPIPDATFRASMVLM